MKLVSKIVLLLAAAAVMTACASSAAASNTVGASPSAVAKAPARIAPVNPCTLVTASEASKVAGRTLVNSVTLGASPIAGGCFYSAHGTTSAVIVYMQVYPDSATAGAVTVEQFEAVMAVRLGATTGDPTRVDGIGDKAFEFTAKGGYGSAMGIVVFRSNVVFVVVVAPTTDASTVQGLARTAVGRLH